MKHISYSVWYVWTMTIILFYLPSIIVSGYCIYKIIRVCCKCKCKRQSSAPVDDDDDEQSPLLQQPNINISVGVSDSFDADRIVNPDDYDERHFSNRWLQPHLLSRCSTISNSNVLNQTTADGTEFSNH